MSKENKKLIEAEKLIEKAQKRIEPQLVLQNKIEDWLIETPDGDKSALIQQLIDEGYSAENIDVALGSIKADHTRKT